ncbi:MAG: TetR/AcrR family transcriptional regulator [Spirulina sp.]
MHSKSANSSGRQKSTEKAAAILEGAMREFLTHGYAATNMDGVAAAAGVSKATVYRYFQDKEGLFAALVKRLAEEKYRTVFNPFNDKILVEEPKVFLHHLATKVLENAGQDPQMQAFMRTIIAESGRFPELSHPYIENLAKPVLETLSTYFASRAEFVGKDSDVLARSFMGSIIYFVMLQEILGGKTVLPMERDRFVKGLVELFS